MRHSTFITLVTNCRDLSGVAQRMRNSGYPHLSCLSCYHPQGSVWSCTAHAQQRLSSFITLVTTPRDLSGVVQRMRNRRIIHIYHTCYSVWSCTVHAQQALFPIITLVTNCRDLYGVSQRMRNRHYSELSRFLPPAVICLELHSACTKGIIPNYHACYHPQ